MAPTALEQSAFYEHDGFRGHAFTTADSIENFRDQKFNDRASSMVVERRLWKVCQDNGFGGSCVALRAGQLCVAA